MFHQGSHRLDKYLNIEGFLEKYLKIKFALKSTGKSLKGLENSLNSTIYMFVCLFALRPKSTAMVIAGRSVHLITRAAPNKGTTILC